MYGPTRRAFVLGVCPTLAATALPGGPGLASMLSANAGPFDHAKLRAIASALAGKPFNPSKIEPSSAEAALSYDQYRDIRFRPEQAVWRPERLGQELQLFPVGWLFNTFVDLFVVDGGEAVQVAPDPAMFDLGPLARSVVAGHPPGFSGFRVHAPINRPDYLDEYAVFQGASYFRAVGQEQTYGLSARGLAIDTAQPAGEEFPLFRAFYVEKPKSWQAELVVHGLLDSPRTTGAYRFVIRPGPATIMDVEAVLYPRETIEHVGLAPMTSMFLHGPAGPRISGDFRPEVHDSEGLAIQNGKGECLWRPLTNPGTLQTSVFLDRDPKGFGLVQRDRSFASFEDLEARYERRPTLWVQPRGSWGDGSVRLFELPSDEEIHDNIVVFWQPAIPLSPGSPHEFAYRLTWGADPPTPHPGARVRKTRLGTSTGGKAPLVIVDFDGPSLPPELVPAAEISASAGAIVDPVVQRHPEIQGLRCSFRLDAAGAETSELRLVLKADDRPISETWLYRWTKI